VIGKSHTGKSGVTKLLSEKLNLVRIKISSILEDFLGDHPYTVSDIAIDHLRNGGTVPDDVLVSLIIKRIQLADCIDNGWVLEGFP